MKPENQELIVALKHAVGSRNVLTRARHTRRFTQGWRYGGGDALAVIRPRSLIALWTAAKLIAASDKIIIMQAANTGLTGGSTPQGSYDRGVVIINTMHLARAHYLPDTKQLVCLPGATLHDITKLLEQYDREPHSEIGSSCIGASVFGGVCNNSGGALIRRGPAFTQAALFGRSNADGTLELINHTGLELGTHEEDILFNAELGIWPSPSSTQSDLRCSREDYVDLVKDMNAKTPARFNADSRGLFEASGSAGKLIVLAMRLDTFPKTNKTQTLLLGTNNPDALTQAKRNLVEKLDYLPITAEYVHRDVFNLASQYGRDTIAAIRLFGTERLPFMFATKARIDAMLERASFGSRKPGEHFMQWLSRFLPHALPQSLARFSERFEHIVLVRVEAEFACKVSQLLDASLKPSGGEVLHCDEDESKAAFLQRFAAAGAAMRYDVIHNHKRSKLVAIDVALPRKDQYWDILLPPDLEAQIERTFVYGHFFCNVWHLDYIVKPDTDPALFEHLLVDHFHKIGAECPAEHNVGHLYEAKPELANFYKSLDPANILNPGVGKTSRARNWN